MTDPVVVLILLATGLIRLTGAVIDWLAARSGERTRARTLIALLRLAGPGSTLTDQRFGGVSLTVSTGQSARPTTRPTGPMGRPAGQSTTDDQDGRCEGE